MERQPHVALARVVVDHERTPTARKVVEGAGFLGLPDEALGERYPVGSDAEGAVGVAPDGGAARLRLGGQLA